MVVAQLPKGESGQALSLSQLQSLSPHRIDVKVHHAETSVLEGIVSRGDRALCKVIERAWRMGCRFDGWTDHFDFQKWMEASGLASDTAIKLGIGYDDPHITAAEKCRYDACVVVPEDFPSDKWVNVVDLPGGKVAVSQFMGGAHEISEAWNQVFSAWLPESGYQPDDRPCVEVYRGHAGVDGKPGVFRCELCLPVRPL